eukprot:CAMPEP_0178935920 /NCGR_PEP_ID=MMETSP0786-20121207/24840_1 /TAXON_ID=186022 /ORGANISM="Thalassionema frauenfeldii, Strain CCMP 1798" /LENGTH=394 /DNA_ID=CAMNT_0020614175 /DNA_START=126 /DNA_END=1307 /DNA_ORIENTATION=+
MSKKNRNNGNRRRKNSLKLPSLEAFTKVSLEEERSTYLLVDFNNVRGKSDFALTNHDLLFQLDKWKSSFSSQRKVQIICVIDHGAYPHAYQFGNLGLVIFAGPDRTADDIIVKATRWLIVPNTEDVTEIRDATSITSFDSNMVVSVVTSDRELKMRCLRIKRLRRGNRNKKSISAQAKVFESFQLLDCLRKFSSSNVNVKSAGDNSNPKNTKATATSIKLRHVLKQELARLERDIRFYDYKHPPWESGQEQVEASEAVPYKTTVLSNNITDNLITQFQEENNEVCSPKKVYNEKTWHRVLIAENMRRMLDRVPVSVKTPNDILLQYQCQYNKQNSTNEFPPNLFLDHRLRFEPHLQEELVQYFDRALTSSGFGVLQITPDDTLTNSGYVLQKRW